MSRPGGTRMTDPYQTDHYQLVYDAVCKMLEAGESEESVNDAVNAACEDAGKG